MNVLLTDAQDVQSITVARSLHKRGCKVYGFMTSRISYGYTSRFFHRHILCPDVKNEPENFGLFLRKFLAETPINVIIPLSDGTAAYISQNKNELEKIHGVRCAVPGYEIFHKAHNKQLLMELCRRIGAPHPKTIELTPDNLVQASAYTGFPALIKPNISEGARGIVYVNDIDRLHEVFPSVQATFGACTLQEFIHHSGVYYNVMLYRDRNGKCLGSTVIKILRYFPLKGGTSCYSVSVENPELTEICFRVLEKIDWIGFADFDIMQEAESGDYKIIEINPRTPASLKASLASGVDFPAIILYDTLGHPVPKVKYEPGKILRYMGLDVMWFLFSPDRFRIRPSWFKFFGRNIYYEDGTWSDPLPMLAGCFAGVIKYLNPKFRKSKLN